MPNRRHTIISDFLDYIKNVRLYSKHTLRSYAYDLDDYLVFCHHFDSNREFTELEQTAIQAYLQYLSQGGLNAKTLARRLASIKSLYKYMSQHKLVNVNIAQGVKTPKIRKELPQFLSLKQAEKILTLPLGNDEKAFRERLLLELFYSTGVRISELVSIRFRDIRMEEGIIHIFGKGGRERIVMIGSDTQITLRHYRKFLHERNIAEQDHYLFPALRRKKHGRNGHIATRTVFNVAKKYLRMVSDDEKLSPHSLRHTFATHMLNNGADLIAIKDLLGHTSLSSTQVYTHLKPEKLKKIYEKSHPHGK